MYNRFPGTEDPAEYDGVVNYFMESLPRIDPFAYLQTSRLRVIMNRRLLRDWMLEDPADIPDVPTEPLGAWHPLSYHGTLVLESTYSGVWHIFAILPDGTSTNTVRHPLSNPDRPCGTDEF